jgi:hypothetical protein
MGLTRFQFHLRNGRNRCQCLATKTHGAQLEQIFGCADLGCSVAFQTHARISFAHALAIVNDLDELFTSIADDELNFFRACIQGVLEQLLYSRGRALHHFTSSDLVGDGIGKQVNDIGHGRKLFEMAPSYKPRSDLGARVGKG